MPKLLGGRARKGHKGKKSPKTKRVGKKRAHHKKKKTAVTVAVSGGFSLKDLNPYRGMHGKRRGGGKKSVPAIIHF